MILGFPAWRSPPCRSTYGWIYHINPSYSAESETFRGSTNHQDSLQSISCCFLPTLHYDGPESGLETILAPLQPLATTPAVCLPRSPKAWEIPGEVHQKRLTRPLRAPARKKKSQRALQFEVSSPMLEGWTWLWICFNLLGFLLSVTFGW